MKKISYKKPVYYRYAEILRDWNHRELSPSMARRLNCEPDLMRERCDLANWYWKQAGINWRLRSRRLP